MFVPNTGKVVFDAIGSAIGVGAGLWAVITVFSDIENSAANLFNPSSGSLVLLGCLLLVAFGGVWALSSSAAARLVIDSDGVRHEGRKSAISLRWEEVVSFRLAKHGVVVVEGRSTKIIVPLYVFDEPGKVAVFVFTRLSRIAV